MILIDNFTYGLYFSLTALVGILTLFGSKKKNNNSSNDSAAEKVSDSVGPPTNTQTDTAKVSPTHQDESTFSSFSPQPSQAQWSSTVRTAPTSSANYQSEETSLSKLLQSLLQDLPNNQTRANLEISSSPEYVPPRITPTSRPMMIEPTTRNKQEIDAEEEDSSFQAEPVVQPVFNKPTEAQPVASAKQLPQQQQRITSTPVPSSPTRLQEVAVEKPGKLDKTEKPSSSKATTLRKSASTSQEFTHIFSLSQGSLETQGLVIVNAAKGSGRTTLCSALVDNYEKLGNPCLYLTCDQSPADLRNQMKKLGNDPSPYESQFRFILIDGYASQSESFSMEPYYVEQPFNIENIQDVILRNGQIFTGEKSRIFIDSFDQIIEKVPQKEFAKKFSEFTSKMRDLGATIVLTADLTKYAKETSSLLEDNAQCVIDLIKTGDDDKSRELKVRKANGTNMSKTEAELVHVEPSKGLVFV